MSLEPFEYFQIVCALWFRQKFLDLVDPGKDTLNVAPVVNIVMYMYLGSE